MNCLNIYLKELVRKGILYTILNIETYEWISLRQAFLINCSGDSAII